MEFKTNYPYIFVHGMFGYGRGTKLNDYAPYFGLFGGDITKYFNEHGMEAYAASVGPYSSAWDRACELYAQIIGGTVDYGKAHSERFGHARFGRTYNNPFVKDWGKLGPDGKIKKINLIGHSYGGATTRLLICLLADGCTAEKQMTDPSDISPLFTGGKADWVHSESTYVAPHNGMTLFPAMGKYENLFRHLIYGAANATANTPLPKFYDFYLDQFGLTTDPYMTNKAVVDNNRVEEVIASKDNVFYGLSVEGAKELNSHLYCVPGVYYFSYTGHRTRKIFNGNHIANKDMFFIFKLSGLLIGSRKNDAVKNLGSDWLENDGIINTYSGTAPLNEPSTDINMVKDIKSGIWYKMGNLDMDHLTFCGYGIKHKDICDFYFKHAEGINRL